MTQQAEETEMEIVEIEDDDVAEDVLRDVVYDRNRELYDQDKLDAVHVVGAGGIGTWVAISTAMAGCQEIHLYDEDVLEMHNLNRLPFTREDIGEPKTEVVKNRIQELRPQAEVHTHGFVEDEDDLTIDPDREERVVICVDSADANDNVVEAVDDACPAVRAAYDGDNLAVHDAQEQFSDGDDGYGVDPSYVVTPMMAAGLVVEKLYRNEDLELFSTQVEDLASTQ